MSTALLLAVAFGLPTAVAYAAVAVVRWRRWAAARRPALAAEPIERLTADLRRLHAEVDRTETAVRLPAKNLRCRAVRAAYVDALSAACRRFDVPPPTGSPGASVPVTEIYRVEAALRGHGIDVRGASAR
ncbi:MAG: hypothetical protein QOH14_1936 [Pseudonocardiales bacterium]|nr:hypothetical protein [Pseudonocardiales bacterium]